MASVQLKNRTLPPSPPLVKCPKVEGVEVKTAKTPLPDKKIKKLPDLANSLPEGQPPYMD